MNGMELDRRLRAILLSVTPKTAFSSAAALVDLGFDGVSSFRLVMSTLENLDKKPARPLQTKQRKRCT